MTQTKPTPGPFTIIAVNERQGSGNGWHVCDETKATGYEVDDGSEVVAFFDTKKEAEAFIQAQS